MRGTFLAPLMIAALLSAGHAADAPAPDDPSAIMQRVINNPAVSWWQFYGLSQSPEPRQDGGVQGGSALRIAVPGKGANPWDVSATMAITKDVKSGDVLLFAFWARAEVPAEGKQTGIIPEILIQQANAPYAAIGQSSATLSGTWTMYYASGVAPQDEPAGSINASLHLAAAKQTVDVGPAFVVDLGAGYDRSKLPTNPLSASEPVAGAPQQAWSPQEAETRFAAELAKIRALLPVHGRLMNDPSISTVSAYGADQTNEVVASPDMPGGQALRVSVTHGVGDSYSVGTSSPVRGDIRKGDVVFFAIYARATETSNEGQYGTISAINVQSNQDPWTVVAGTAAQAPLNTWRVFYGYGTAPIDIASGGATLSAQIGRRKQTIEFGPAFVFDLGPGADTGHLPINRITYPGREPNAPWRAAAAARIRKYRMGDLSVAVSDGAGHPVRGASVHFAMRKHLYRFGGFAGFDLAVAPGPDGDKLRETFLQTFNFATSPLYWADWGWADPATRGNMTASMRWLQEHGYSFRGHPVIYPNEDATPGYVKKLVGDKAAVSRAVLDHVREVVPVAAKYGACCLDVVNEPRDGVYLPKVAGDDIFPDAYRTAHQLGPDLHLFINDYGIVSGGGMNAKNIAFYHQWIDDALAKGVPLSGIGIQGHFGGELTDPARVIAIIDDFAKYHLPIEITEFDVQTGDQDAQADFTRDMLTAAFSDPATDAFVTWGWRDFEHPQQAMFNRDWTLKPNGRAWMKSIYRDWWTDETLTTGADGTAQTRAFYGTYRIVATSGVRTVEHDVEFGPGTTAIALKFD